MKKNLCKMLIAVLALVLMLSACGGEQTPEEIVKKQLTSDVWYADMSEGTVAGYTFTKDGNFTCEASVSVGDKSASLVREGTYQIASSGDVVLVSLQYPDVGYLVEITCKEKNGSYEFEIAGCPMYQK